MIIIKELFFYIAILLFPYNILGEEAGAHILFALLISFFIFSKKATLAKLNKTYFFLVLGVMAVAIFTSLLSENIIRSFCGVSLYGCALLGFLFAKKIKEERFTNYLVYIMSICGAITVTYEGALRGIRIYGNYGYANTYALILFIALVLSEVNVHKKFDFYIKLSLMVSILFTGDRTLLIILVLWIIYSYLKAKNLKLVLQFVVSIIQYILLSNLGIIGLLLLPLTLIILHTTYKSLIKLNRKTTTLIALLALISISLSSSNTLARIKNISFKNPSLIERLISFQDTLKLLPQNLLGRGANSYEYSQYIFKSAFYEAKYLHNSALQHLHDFGLIGFLLFIFIIGFGLYILIKSTNKNKNTYMIIYLSIVVHSMMNFDTVFPTVWIILSCILAFNIKDIKDIKDSLNFPKLITRVILITILACIVPLGVHESLLSIINNTIRGNNIAISQNFLKFYSNLNIDDDRLYTAKASLDKLNFENTGDKSFLDKSIKSLQHAMDINSIDPRIKWNLAFLLTKECNFQEAEKLWELVLSQESYNKETYSEYLAFLNEAYIDREDAKKIKIMELESFFNKSIKNINPKAHLLPNQLNDSLMNTLEENHK